MIKKNPRKEAWELIKKALWRFNHTQNKSKYLCQPSSFRNDKLGKKVKKKKIIRDRGNKSHNFHQDFLMEELVTSLKEMKNAKMASYDEIAKE